MLRRLVLICLLLIATVAVADVQQENDDLLKNGNGLYTEGKYQEAIDQYSKILANGQHSSELYYNLGNASFREGRLGLAIINYIRASRLDPRDDDIRTNLEFARQFVVDKIEITEETIIFEYINNFFGYFSLDEVTSVTLVLFVLLAILVILGVIYRRFEIPMPLITVVIVLLVISTAITTIKIDRDILTRNGVILALSTEIKNGPGAGFDLQVTVHAGLNFKIEREEAGYYLVSFENRLKGWVDKSAVGEI